MASEFILDGFPTQIVFADLNTPALAAIIYVEREVKLPKVEVGEIDVKNMRNLSWRPKIPKRLRSVGDITCVMIYDLQIYALLHSHIGVPTRCKIGVYNSTANWRFASFDKVWIDSIDPQSHKEGELPTMEMVIKPTMLGTGGFNTEQSQGSVYQATAPW